MDKVEIKPPNPQWPTQFLHLKSRILSHLGQSYPIEHIGSTSVPGLPAKDIIDMQFGVEGFDPIEPLVEALEKIPLKFTKEFNRDHIPMRPFDEFSPEWEKRFLTGSIDGIALNLHIRKVGNLNWNYALLFRDFLRSHSEQTAAYAQVKVRLSELPINRRDYTYVKDPVLDLIYLQAREWSKKLA